MELSTRTLIQNIFRCYEKQLRSQARPVKHLKAIDAIVHCRTAHLGMNVYECKQDLKLTRIYHSCRHRGCYLCAYSRREQWISAQRKKLLNCKHFHVIFTLAHEYLNLWRYNQKWFANALFAEVSGTLMELLVDKKRQGLRPGILMALHTWGRQLTLHPHMHCLVTGGGLDDGGQWKESGEYLLPVKLVKARYRSRMQARIKKAYESGELVLPPDHDGRVFWKLHKEAWSKQWSVRIEPRYAHGSGVMLYLSRYLLGGPLNPKQIVRCDADKIGFRYKDHRDKRTKVLELKTAEFLRRLLEHVPEPGQQVVRHYGLYASASRDKRNRCREQLGGIEEDVPGQEAGAARAVALRCVHCGQGLRLLSVIRGGRKANSYKGESAQINVQQKDQPDMAEVKKTSSRMRV